MNDFQWTLFETNVSVLVLFFLMSGFIGKLIPRRKKWLFPLTMPVLLFIGLLLIFYVFQPDAEFYFDYVLFAFDWLGFSNVVTGYLIYSVFIFVLFLLGKVLYALFVLFLKRFPEPFYGRKLDNGTFEVYPQYDIFNIVFKVLFIITLLITVVYSIFSLDILLAVLNVFTLLVYEIFVLFPQKTTEFKERDSLDVDNDVEEHIYKNKEEFEKFLKYVNEEYEDSDKLNATGKLRELE